MKKTIGLILFILVMIFTVGSYAEQAPADMQNVQTIDAMGAFKVSAQIPEGYRFSGTYASDILYVGYLTPQNPALVNGMITIAFDEEADGASIGDLSQEIINAITQQDIRTLGEKVEFSETATSHGTKLLVYHVTDPEEERIEIYTLYMGYQIRCILFPAKGQKLTQQDLKMAVDFVSEVWITK